jgi:hypothetical protein
MKSFLIAALSATTICGFAALTLAVAQATAPGAPRGTAPVTIEGYGPSSAIVCDQAGTTGRPVAAVLIGKCAGWPSGRG